MYAVEVREHIMVAHSLKGEVFGPAQGLHGATYVVAVAFLGDSLDANGIVVDIALAGETLKRLLKPLNYANLDELPEFAGRITTTEVLCRHLFDRMAEAVREGALGAGAKGLRGLRVTLEESPAARAWYEAPLGA